MYRGELVYIRKMILEDAPVVLEWENEPENWLISEGEGPYILEDIIDLVNNIEDIKSSCQVRYMILLTESDRQLGTIDLFNINFARRSAGVGILIADRKDRGKGYGKESLLLLEELALYHGLEMLEAAIHEENQASKALFRSCGYVYCDRKNDTKSGSVDYLDKLFFEKWLKRS